MQAELEQGRQSVHRFTGKDKVQFGFGLPQEVNEQLQKAASNIAYRPDTLKALCVAKTLAPKQLEVLVALYKFHFYEGELEKAEEFVFQALIKAAQEGGFKYDLDSLNEESTDWNAVRGPARTFLYSLKALAFIRLRQNDTKNAEIILDNLQRLDPQDQVGADVIRDLFYALKETIDE